MATRSLALARTFPGQQCAFAGMTVVGPAVIDKCAASLTRGLSCQSAHSSHIANASSLARIAATVAGGGNLLVHNDAIVLPPQDIVDPDIGNNFASDSDVIVVTRIFRDGFEAPPLP